ncbi:MAG: hypothetical protein HKN72_07525 [Gemmatimonadetes bacterium]|nr:hypothetical protein [Gemmatimonadota bacterium]NNL31190.1 hypothetical protein [Gemmatimonadota bacterium]
MTLWFLVVTGVLGLAIGIWLGMPGRYTQTPDEIEKIMESGGSRRRRAKRIFTPLAWMQRQISTSGPSADRRRKRGSRSGFKLESPEDRES